MKTVFSNAQCAHVWAQQSQPFGRSSSMEFDGAVLKSYSTPIAAFSPVTPSGYRPVLITSHSYSATTNGKHIPAARSAVRGARHVFHVPDVGHAGDRADTARVGPASDFASWAPVHANNLAYLVAGWHERIASELRRRTWWQEPAEIMVELHKEIADYCIAFCLPMPALDMPEAVAQIRTYRADMDARKNDPAAKARLIETRAKRIEAAQRKHAASIEAWRAYGTALSQDAQNSTGGALLRIAGGEVVTSLGARVPLNDARRVLDVVDHIRASGTKGWRRPADDDRARYALGPFVLDSVDARGVHAGCHFISWAEIDRARPAIKAG